MQESYILPFEEDFLLRLDEHHRKGILRFSNSFDIYSGEFYFETPVGTKIVACRSGIIVKADRTNIPRDMQNDWDYAHEHNLVLIEHEDGTSMNYIHLDTCLKPGDRIAQGEDIGVLIRGLKGYDPHLHMNHHSVYGKKRINFTNSSTELEGMLRVLNLV